MRIPSFVHERKLRVFVRLRIVDCDALACLEAIVASSHVDVALLVDAKAKLLYYTLDAWQLCHDGARTLKLRDLSHSDLLVAPVLVVLSPAEDVDS